MLPVGFETTISAGERPQTYALNRAAIGTGFYFNYLFIFIAIFVHNQCRVYFPDKITSSKLFLIDVVKYFC